MNRFYCFKNSIDYFCTTNQTLKMIRILEKADRNIVKQLDRLLHRLNPSAPETDAERLETLVRHKRMAIFVSSSDDGAITGMLTLTHCPTLTGNKYWIEDVIVDDEFRGRGIGRSLVQAAVNHLKEKEKFPVLYLTSNPSRIQARNLYRSEGFEEYETGVFRLKTTEVQARRS